MEGCNCGQQAGITGFVVRNRGHRRAIAQYVIGFSLHSKLYALAETTYLSTVTVDSKGRRRKSVPGKPFQQVCRA
jgi:hypothetical protein